MPRFEEEIQKAIAENVFPGAALLVSSRGEILAREFFGNATLIPAPEPVTDKTLFDIASLTKPVATATLMLAARRDQKLSLGSPVVRILKDFDGDDKKKITIRHLLKHTSGLPAWRPYYEEIAREHPESIGKRECRQFYLGKIFQEPLEVPVGFQRIYSDLGFMLLGFLLEEFWGGPLDRLFLDHVAQPLELTNTFFIPDGTALSPGRFAATEDSVWRKKLIRGEVHDNNAYALGGVAGHAGLFSTVDDLHRFLLAIRQGYRQGHPVIPQSLATEALGPRAKLKLGWDTPSEDSQAGQHFSRQTVGHLGYSGCSFWIDLEKDFHIILLTNRVHPSSKNESIKQFRPKIHDLIYEELIAPGL